MRRGHRKVTIITVFFLVYEVHCYTMHILLQPKKKLLQSMRLTLSQ